MRDSDDVATDAANPMELVSPDLWYSRMPAPDVIGCFDGATFRHFDGTSRSIEQPALDENVVAIHLGGPKRVTRWQGACRQTWDVPVHSLTFMPAFRANRWHTDGVVEYAHLTLGADLLARFACEEFDKQPGELVLLGRVGVTDPLIAELMLSLHREAAMPERNRLYRESLLTTLALAAMQHHSTLGSGAMRAGTSNKLIRGGLAGWQLRRITEYMEANVARDIGVDELVCITGLSRSQFFRAFRRSTGETPANHMQRLRMRYAGTLLLEGRPVGDVAALLGYVNHSQFSAAFARANGISPSMWRRMQKVTAR